MPFRKHRPLPFHRDDFPKDVWIQIGYEGLGFQDQSQGPDFRRGLDWPLPPLDVTFCHAVGEVPFTRKVLRGRKTSLFPRAGRYGAADLLSCQRPRWGSSCRMSCQSGSDRGRRKVQVVDDDVAPERDLSSFTDRRFTGEIDCPCFFVYSRRG